MVLILMVLTLKGLRLIPTIVSRGSTGRMSIPSKRISHPYHLQQIRHLYRCERMLYQDLETDWSVVSEGKN